MKLGVFALLFLCLVFLVFLVIRWGNRQSPSKVLDFSELGLELKVVESFPSSPQVSDLFQPFMPGVDLLSDMDALFAKARSILGDVNPVLGNQKNAQRYIAIITPGRMFMFEPCPPPGSMSPEGVQPIEQLLPPERRLNISVIAYTYLEAVMQDKSKSIPFLGFLLAFGYIGHSVVVFEGHPSAFESGIRNSDVLLVDSGMVPFLQKDWLDIADKVMRPDHKILIHNRADYSLRQVIKRGDTKEWTDIPYEK